MVVPHFPREADPQAEARNLLEWATRGEAAGFDSLHAPEHYFAAEHYFALMPTLSRFVEHTETVDVVSTICLLPLANPAMVAERAATLDVYSGGRLVVGVAAGYKDVQFETAGVPKSERGSRLAEGIEVLKTVWTSDPAEFDGEHYHLEGLRSFPKPVQNPRPMIWVGGHAPAAIRRAARLGDAWIPSPIHGLDELEPAVAHYEDHLEGQPAARPIRRDCFVAPTTERAREIAGPHVVDMFREVFEGFGALAEWADDQPEAVDDEGFLDFLVETGRVVIGSPDAVVDQLESLEARFGFDYPVLRVRWPGMAHDEALTAVDLLGEEVLPHLREI